MKNYNPLQAIEDMAEGKKINFFNYMELGGFRPIGLTEEITPNENDIVFSLVMNEKQYDKFLNSMLLVFEIAELSSIIGDMLNQGIILAVKMDLLESNEFGVTFIKEIQNEIDYQILGIKDKPHSTRTLK